MQGSVTVIIELMKFDKNGVISARNRITEATPLQLAAEGGHAQVVKVLVRAGASCSDENKVVIATNYRHFFLLSIPCNKIQQFNVPGRIHSCPLSSTKWSFSCARSITFVPIAKNFKQEAWYDGASYGSVLWPNRYIVYKRTISQ